MLPILNLFTRAHYNESGFSLKFTVLVLVLIICACTHTHTHTHNFFVHWSSFVLGFLSVCYVATPVSLLFIQLLNNHHVVCSIKSPCSLQYKMTMLSVVWNPFIYHPVQIHVCVWIMLNWTSYMSVTKHNFSFSH